MPYNYLQTHNNFSDFFDKDIARNSNSDYWYLNSHTYNEYIWNTDIFSNDEIERIKVLGRRLKPKRALASTSNLLDYRRSFVSWISSSNESAWIYRKLTDLIQENNKQFFQFDIDKIETLQFTYYDSNEQGCYKSHKDPLTWNTPHNRKLSLVLQLSDPSEYEGGEFLLHNSTEPIVIGKEKGMIVTFPSYTLHEVTPVTKGERYSLVAWVHGPPFK
jgi:PKHD-type hydroxylase